MPFDAFNRRTVSAGLMIAGIGLVQTASAQSGNATISAGAPGEISHSRAGIHQEITFAASAARVYRLLTEAEQFDHAARLSGAMNSMMSTWPGGKRSEIDARPGGAFALFGGYVTGFNLELVRNTRLVQAWRAGSWSPGLFSIARFALSEREGVTALVFDHLGFPDDAAAHLAHGWHINYWEPMTKVLT